jgi:hypothetical protein
MDCYEAIDVMGDAVEGRLKSHLRSSFDEHIHECRPCASYLDNLRVTREALRHLPPEGGTSPRRQELIDAFRKEFQRGSD